MNAQKSIKKSLRLLDRCGKRLDAHEASLGVTSVLDVEEFAYALIEGAQRLSSEGARLAQDEIRRRALASRGKGKPDPWTMRYRSLRASDDEILDGAWKNTHGLLRVCVLTRVSMSVTDSKIVKCNADKGLLLDFMSNALDNVHFRVCDLTDFGVPNDIVQSLTGTRCFLLTFSENKVSYLLVTKSHILPDPEVPDVLARLTSIRQVVQKIAPNSETNFFCVVDPARLDRLPLELPDFLAYAYRRILGFPAGTSFEGIEPCPIDRYIRSGLTGIEGTILVSRRLSPKEEFVWRGSNIFWGGEVFVAWIVSLYQRDSIIDLGKTAAKPYVSGSASQPIDPVDLDKHWRAVAYLESAWMYQEFSVDTDVDNLYRCIQKVFDIQTMWEDVREQTELILRIDEARRTRTISDWQTFGGFFFGALLLLAGFFGMNFKEFEKDGGYPMALGSPWVWFVIAVTIFATVILMFEWWLQSSLWDRARRIRESNQGWGKYVRWICYFSVVVVVMILGFNLISSSPSTTESSPSAGGCVSTTNPKPIERPGKICAERSGNRTSEPIKEVITLRPKASAPSHTSPESLPPFSRAK